MDQMKEFPTLLTPGKLYICFTDVCREGLQFCNVDISERRCEYCNAHFYDCFTYHQQVNCSQYCMDQWKQNVSQIDCGEQSVDVFKILFFILLGICCVGALIATVICFPFIHKFMFSKLRLRRSVGRGQCNSVVQSFQVRRPSMTSSPVQTGTSVSIPQPAIQEPDFDTERLEGEGSSHIGHRSESRGHVRNTTPTFRNSPTQCGSSTFRKQINDQVEEQSPFISPITEDVKLSNLKIDNATNANGVIAHNELSHVQSSGYQGLHPAVNASRDTGYRTASTGQ